MKLLKILISLIIVLILLSLIGYFMMPGGEDNVWVNLNPFEMMSGIVFTLSFAFGVPVWLTIAMMILLFFLLWYVFYLVINSISIGRIKE